MAVRIAVEAEHALPRFVLAPQLAALLGFEAETRESITRALWTYIRMHSLQACLARVLPSHRRVLPSPGSILLSWLAQAPALCHAPLLQLLARGICDCKC